jgi:WD40 repeat protein
MAWSPDGTRIASGRGGDGDQVEVWDATSGKLLLRYKHAGWIHNVRAIAWDRDSTRIVSADDNKMVKVWHAQTGETLRIYSGHGKGVNTVAWSPDGSRIASGSDDNTAQVWQPG